MSYLEVSDASRLQKTIVKEGNADKPTPKRFDKVDLLFRLTTAEGELIEEATSEEKPFQVKVGDRDLMVGFNVALTTMHEGEAAKFHIPEELCHAESDKDEPKEQTETKNNSDGVILEVSLLAIDFGAKVTKWDLGDEEKLPFATSFKDEGNKLFKDGNWAAAEEKYNQAIEIVEWDKSPRRKDLKVNTLYNLSQVLAKQNRFVSAIERINWAINLKPQEAKGYFRKSNVYFAMQEFERSLEELKKAKDIEPTNPDIIAQIAKVKEARDKYRASSQEIFGKIFEKSVYEPKAKCDYSDNLNPLVEMEMSINEEMVCCKVELFSNIMPDTVNYFESLVRTGHIGGYISSEIKKNNFIILNSPQPELEEFREIKPENKSNKVKEAGMIFFKPIDDQAESIAFRSEIGISLAPLPWFDGKWIPFGFICTPVDFKKKLEQMVSKAEDDANENKKPVTLLLKNCRMF